MLILSTQTVRHVYVRGLEPTGSVLDKYDPPVSGDIKKAASLEELVRLYDDAHKNVEVANSQNEDPTTISARKQEKEPYKSETLLREAINDWERKSKEIFELRYFWCSGLVFLIVGFLCYAKASSWLGLTLIIAGFSEMLWATSPSFRFAGPNTEFDRLLTSKIIFSLLSLALLLAMGYFIRAIDHGRATEIKSS